MSAYAANVQRIVAQNAARKGPHPLLEAIFAMSKIAVAGATVASLPGGLLWTLFVGAMLTLPMRGAR